MNDQPWKSYQGLYVHIPFCRQKCCYCDFVSYQGQGLEQMTRYTDALCREIRHWELDLPIREGATVYFGGGTPSCLPLPLLEKIVMTLKERGFWKQPSEATLEANPGTITEESLVFYRRLGFDRLSLGIQSLSDSELELMGRIHTAKEAADAIRLARKAGFQRISADLIYGYPTQTLAGVCATLNKLILLSPDHLSIYGLSVEEGTVLAARLRKGEWTLPDEDTVGAMYDAIMARLPEAGYGRYEISNFARPGQESQHNQIYWHYDPYMAFGAGATRFNGTVRETNPSSLIHYMEGKASEKEILSPLVQQEELVFMSLRTKKGLSLDEFEERTGKKFLSVYRKAFDACCRKGWLELSEGRVRLTPLGMKFGNLAFEEFII